MKKAELNAALEIARSDRSLAHIDDSVLAGLYTREFVGPVTTTVEVVARTLRDLVCQFNGGIDAEALTEFGEVARRKILIVG